MRTWRARAAGISAALVAGVGLACGGSDAAACKDAEKVEASQLLSGVPDAYDVKKIPESEAKSLLEQFPEETRKDIAAVTLAVANKPDTEVVVYALTSANEKLDPEDELKGFRESAEAKPEDLDVGGEKGLLQTVPDGTLGVGTAGDCGAVLLISTDEASVREVAKALRPPKG